MILLAAHGRSRARYHSRRTATSIFRRPPPRPFFCDLELRGLVRQGKVVRFTDGRRGLSRFLSLLCSRFLPGTNTVRGYAVGADR